MKRENRVLKHREFSEILSNCPFAKEAHFVVHYRPNKADKLRVGIQVGRRNGGAVRRNKIKRQIRTLCLNAFEFGKSGDLIVVVRLSYDPKDYLKAKEELGNIWAEIGEKLP